MHGGSSSARRWSSSDSGGSSNYGGRLQRCDWESMGSSPRKRRVMVVVDESQEAKHALMFALSRVINTFDTITLLTVIDDQNNHTLLYKCRGGIADAENRRRVRAKRSQLTNSFKGLCKARRPEVEVEVVVMEGDKAATVVSQANNMEASVLVLGHRRPSLFQRIFARRMGLVKYCIDNAECLTLAVRKQNERIGGYLINSRYQRNFWLLA